ncbi:uncharacterized protein [Henckelia pumila]|uniref:uncharacterized protein n=1 Tax=Henckelia pumila TaxID=405737 RepID=UPI003C6E464D
MERSQSQVIESMKKTMLTHEQIFKQQVKELHRLYDLQKMLMHELRNEQSWRRNESIISQSFTTLFKRDDPVTELGGTSCSGESSRLMPIRFDHQLHPDNEQNDVKKIEVEDDLEVELTLSIGHCTGGKKSTRHRQQCNPQFLDFDGSNPVEESGSLSRINTGEDEAYGEPSAASLNQENGQPHWLLQDLSLNRR